MTETRTCAKCGLEKPLAEMAVYRPRGSKREHLPAVMSTWCIPCRDEARKASVPE